MSSDFDLRTEFKQFQLDLGTEFKSFQLDLQQNFTKLFIQNEKRFEQVDKRFEQVDKRLEQVDKRLEQVDKQFEQVDKRFEQVNKRFKQVDKRLEQIDERLEQVDIRFEQVDMRFEQVDMRFEQVDKRFEDVNKQLRENNMRLLQIDGQLRNQIATSPWSVICVVPRRDGRKPDRYPDRVVKFWQLRLPRHRKYFLELISFYVIFDDDEDILDEPVDQYVTSNLEEVHARLAHELHLDYPAIKVQMDVYESKSYPDLGKRSRQPGEADTLDQEHDKRVKTKSAELPRLTLRDLTRAPSSEDTERIPTSESNIGWERSSSQKLLLERLENRRLDRMKKEGTCTEVTESARDTVQRSKK